MGREIDFCRDPLHGNMDFGGLHEPRRKGTVPIHAVRFSGGPPFRLLREPCFEGTLGFFVVRSAVAAFGPAGRDRALGDFQDLHIVGAAADFLDFARRHPEEHRRVIDHRFDRCCHSDIVARDIAKQRPEQFAAIIEVVARRGRL